MAKEQLEESQLKTVIMYWVEVRPLLTGRFEPFNFKQVLDALYGFSKPFKVFFVCGTSDRAAGRKTVKMFIGFEDERACNQTKEILEATLAVQVTPNKPPIKQYRRKIELQMQQHYALPITDLSGKLNYNPIDSIIGALAGLGDGAIEIIAIGDPRARGNVYKFIMEKSMGQRSLQKQTTDLFFGIGAEIAVERDMQDVRREAWWKAGKRELSEWDKVLIKEASVKMRANQFKCEINVYGEPETVSALLGALPAAMNKLQTYHTDREKSPSLLVTKPSSYTKEKIYSFFIKYSALALLAVAIFTGTFELSGLGTFGFKEMVILVGAALLAVPNLFYKKRKKIILSSDELSTIVGMPTAIGKLPVELGTTPVTRRGLVAVSDQERSENQPKENQ